MKLKKTINVCLLIVYIFSSLPYLSNNYSRDKAGLRLEAKTSNQKTPKQKKMKTKQNKGHFFLFSERDRHRQGPPCTASVTVADCVNESTGFS